MADHFLIRLPWPPKECSPNAKSPGKWRSKSEAAKAYKNECIQCLWEQKVRGLPFKTAEIHITIMPPDNRKRDLDNVLASIKQGLDAVAERTGIDDSRWLSMHLYRGGKVKGGLVAVLVRDFEAPELNSVEFRGVIS